MKMTTTKHCGRFALPMLLAAMSLVCGCILYCVESKRYCIIDLSAGSDAELYPVTYMAKPPEGGFNTDEYKTTKLVLRLIDPCKFTMGCESEGLASPLREETISNQFYCAIFEVTQKQYELVTGQNPSRLKGSMRPVEMVSWSMAESISFMGKLRKRTALNFNLPSEKQWECACRAGTSSCLNNGGDSVADLVSVARCRDNQNDGKGGYSHGHAVVGSYEPNAWGLYDMHGNVWEWCADDYMLDPSAPGAKSYRGGSWTHSVAACKSAHRGYGFPNNRFNDIGFRLVVNPDKE